MNENVRTRGRAEAGPEQLTSAQVQSSGVTSLEPEFLTVAAACKFSSLGRTEIYLLIRHGRLKSISLRKKGAARGRRLIAVASLRAYLNGFVEGKSA